MTEQQGPKASKRGDVTRRAFASLAGGALAIAITGGALDACAPPESKRPNEFTREDLPETPGHSETISAEKTGGEKISVDNTSTEVGPIDEVMAEPVVDAAEPIVDQGPPDLPPVDLEGRKYVTVELKEHPKMAKVGNGLIVNIPNQLSDLAYLKRTGAYAFSAVSMTCTHQGCTISWRPDKQAFVCPCHVAMFTEGGEVIQGPARRALAVYETAFAYTPNQVYIFYT